MRERIKVGLCKEFTDGISLPGLYNDFEHGFHEMVDLNKAFALMLCKQGIVAKEDVQKILEGLDYAEESLTRENLDPQMEDLYFNVESKMIEKAGRARAGDSIPVVPVTTFTRRSVVWKFVTRSSRCSNS